MMRYPSNAAVLAALGLSTDSAGGLYHVLRRHARWRRQARLRVIVRQRGRALAGGRR